MVKSIAFSAIKNQCKSIKYWFLKVTIEVTRRFSKGHLFNETIFLLNFLKTSVFDFKPKKNVSYISHPFS